MTTYHLYEGDQPVAYDYSSALAYLYRWNPDVGGCEEFHFCHEAEADEPIYSLNWTGLRYREDTEDPSAWAEAEAEYRQALEGFISDVESFAGRKVFKVCDVSSGAIFETWDLASAVRYTLIHPSVYAFSSQEYDGNSILGLALVWESDDILNMNVQDAPGTSTFARDFYSEVREFKEEAANPGG